ncbi:uclacyanin 1-like [Cornus florida]|uniref:uclacyanin 1-like n=1 Tax=Cornus florida TaxID=4283 RepID=UPI0028A1BD05|nr:uclacyanin 1-like [Cornus florida]
MAGLKPFIALVVILTAIGGKWVGAQVNHVAGGDRGWNPSSEVGSSSSGRIFRVGDKIWFTYSATRESIVELKSREEFESCEVNNPIRMYTHGFDGVSLREEGIHYFASGNPESCRKGLKLHVEVQPQHEIQAVAISEAMAAGPTTPSASAHHDGLSYVLFVGSLLCFMGL